MRWRVYLICVWALIFISPAPYAQAQEASNQTIYLNIFLKYNEAFNLEKQGDFRGALNGFQDCLKRLSKLHNSDPNWEAALVIQRMADCKAQIADLQVKVDAMPPETMPNATASDQNPGPNGSTNVVALDTSSLQMELDSVKRELADTKEKLKNSLIETQTYRDQLAAVNQQLDALKSQQSVDDRVGKLLSDNKVLTDKLAEAQKQLDQIKSPQALTLLRAKLKNSEDQLAAAQAANGALQQTTNTLKTQLDQAQTDLSAANQKLAATPTSSPEYATIKHENEIMRGILTREILEQSRRDGAKRLAQEEFDRLKITSKVLQEQLDILGSPMSPPTNDEERMLLANLKGPGMDITTPSNVVAAPNTPPATPSPDSIATNVPPSAPAPPDTSTNTPPVIVMTDNTNTPPAGSSTDTNTPPLVSADSNTPPAAPAVNPPNTNAVASTPDSTAPSTDTNAPTKTQLPAAVTTYTDTTIKNNGTSTVPQTTDPTQFSNKPRLPDDMRDTAQQAADLFKMQRYDDAADKYQSIIDKYPESLYAWSNLGVVRFQQGKLNEALKALQQSVKLSPSDAFSYMNLGIVYYQLNQYENAIDALEHAIALDPNNAKAHNYLGCACSQKGWQEVAEQQFRKAIDIDETFGDAHFNLALVYATSKPPSFELARRHYNRAVELGIGKDARLEKLLQQ